MTNEECAKMLKAKLKCLNRDTSGIDLMCNSRNCDLCELNYEQGNMGEQKEALDMAIKALEQQPCEDCISREKAVYVASGYCAPQNIADELRRLPSATPKAQWIPIKTRPMTEEEKEEIGHEYAFMYDCSLPDDGQDVLITDCYGNVEVDTFCRDHEGVYFETNCDDGEVIAWMPLPQPYKTESEDKE